MFNCPKFGCDVGRLSVLNEKSYYCRRCGLVVPKAKVEEMAARAKFAPTVHIPVPVREAARAERDEFVPRGTSKKKSRSQKKGKRK